MDKENKLLRDVMQDQKKLLIVIYKVCLLKRYQNELSYEIINKFNISKVHMDVGLL